MTDQPCAEFVPLLARAADGDLDPASMARVTSHAASCAGCRAALEDQRDMHRLLGQAGAWSASAGFEGRVASALAARAAWADDWDFRRWTWRLAPVAALVAIAAIAGVIRANRSDSSTAATADDLPVSAALWAGDVSDASVLALMLQAGPNDPLSAFVKGGRQ